MSEYRDSERPAAEVAVARGLPVTRWSKHVGPGDMVRGLSLHEPWASLMTRGAKRIETRPTRLSYRGPLLICAALRRDRTKLASCLSEPAFQRGLGVGPSPVERAAAIDGLGFGHALALVDLYDVVSTDCLIEIGALHGDEESFGDYSSGRFALVTCGLRRLKPFPVRGHQGLMRVTLPEDLEEWSASHGIEEVGCE